MITWAEPPADGQGNPVAGGVRPSWPTPVAQAYHAQVRQAADAVREQIPSAQQIEMPIEGGDSDPWQQRIQRWHDAYGSLVEDSTSERDEQLVRLSNHVGATTFLRALKEPDTVAQDLLRPMPRKPSLAAARGVAWHAWVETAFGQQSLWGMDELPVRLTPRSAASGIGSDAQLQELKAAFQCSRYATRQPVASSSRSPL